LAIIVLYKCTFLLFVKVLFYTGEHVCGLVHLKMVQILFRLQIVTVIDISFLKTFYGPQLLFGLLKISWTTLLLRFVHTSSHSAIKHVG